MIAVKLTKRETDRASEVGRLEFFGLPVGEPQNRTLVDFDTEGARCVEFDGHAGRCVGQAKLTPAGVATDPEIKAIATSLCCHETKCTAGRYEWELIPTTP
jgi:hypothetical protein